MLKSNPYLQLVRPANLITSATDIVAGVTLATLFYSHAESTAISISGFVLLLLASILLYAGGIAFNDVFDLKIDQVERPERPLPSGRISMRSAVQFSVLLLVSGVLLAFGNSGLSGLLALSIALLSLLYNRWSKHHSFGGPLNMGVLRGLNLLLGLSVIPEVVSENYLVALIPVVYIFAITMVSRGEVHGSSSGPLLAALGLFIVTDAAILSYALWYNSLWWPILFALLHLLFILPPLFNAIKDPIPKNIRRTVKHGVIGVIIVDALWVSMTEYWYLAFLLLILLPVSQKLGRYFSVT